MNTATKEAIGDPLPTGFVDINTIPAELEAPCRGASALAFVAPNGIFTRVTKSSRIVTILGRQVEIVTVELFLNPAHRIKPGADVPGCNRDGVLYLPATSTNVSGVSEPQYIRSGADPRNPNAVTSVKLAFVRANRTKPSTLGVRVKFEEGVGQTANFNPKKANGTVTFP